MDYRLNRPFSRGLLLLALCSVLAACGDDRGGRSVGIGEPFPVTRISHIDGSEIDLDGYRGKLLIVHFWATWCAPCRNEMPRIKHLITKLDQRRFAFIAVSVDDDLFLLQEFNLKYGLDFTRYIDPGREIAEKTLAISAYPDSFIVAPNGELLERITGESDWDSPLLLKKLEGYYDLHGGSSL